MHTRIPYDPNYTALVGIAVYAFAYYEWAVIHTIEQFRPGFLKKYCRDTVMTSGAVKGELEAILGDPQTDYSDVDRSELELCCALFGRLIDKRNALIHAHPMTGDDRSQILNFQTKVDRSLPDMKWPINKVEAVIAEFDDAACKTNTLLHRLLK